MYYKFLETFVLNVLFNKGEREVLSKNFNPVKFLVMTFLIGNVVFTGFILLRINKFYNSIQYRCPEVLEDYSISPQQLVDEHLIDYHNEKDISQEHYVQEHSQLYDKKYTSLGFKVKSKRL